MVNIFESFVRLQKEVNAAHEPRTVNTYMSLKIMKLNLDARLN
jgi:hypothetical protein